MMRSLKPAPGEPAPHDPIPFPKLNRASAEDHRDGDRTLRALENVSRRLDDLARRLNCLGFYEETDPNRPRAA
jgi:hypothetical protein